ncbi:MAG: fumarate hydratase C-terminal domain-containing protein, partial [Veillonella sp.]
MAKKILTTPIQQSDLAGIKPGDVIYLTGHITTCRDMGHRRVVEEGKTLPV